MPNKKTLAYWLIVGVLELASLLLSIFCIIKFIYQDNYLTGLSFFSAGLCLLSGIFMLLHIENLFDWFYKKTESSALHASSLEFFSSSIYLAPKDKVYKGSRITTIVLQIVSIVIEVLLLLILNLLTV